MFRPFPNWPSSGWIQCQRNYIPTINIVISVRVSTEKWWETISRLQKAGHVCRLVVEIKYMH